MYHKQGEQENNTKKTQIDSERELIKDKNNSEEKSRTELQQTRENKHKV